MFCGQFENVGKVLSAGVQVAVELTFTTLNLKRHSALFLKVSLAEIITSVIPKGN